MVSSKSEKQKPGHVLVLARFIKCPANLFNPLLCPPMNNLRPGWRMETLNGAQHGTHPMRKKRSRIFRSVTGSKSIRWRTTTTTSTVNVLRSRVSLNPSFEIRTHAGCSARNHNNLWRRRCQDGLISVPPPPARPPLCSHLRTKPSILRDRRIIVLRYPAPPRREAAAHSAYSFFFLKMPSNPFDCRTGSSSSVANANDDVEGL